MIKNASEPFDPRMAKTTVRLLYNLMKEGIALAETLNRIQENVEDNGPGEVVGNPIYRRVNMRFYNDLRREAGEMYSLVKVPTGICINSNVTGLRYFVSGESGICFVEETHGQWRKCESIQGTSLMALIVRLF